MALHKASLAETARTVYLRQSTGVIEYREGGECLYFRDGDLYLVRDHPRAAELEEVLSGSAANPRPAADPELRRLTLALAGELAPDSGSPARFNGGSSTFPGELVGPLPGVLLVMELAVRGCGEQELLARLGGETVRFQSSGETPALQQLPGLETEMAQVLTRLETPGSVAQLGTCSSLDRRAMLQGLAKLRAVGLVNEVESASDRAQKAAEEAEVLSPRILELFSDRIAAELESDPLEIPVEEHCARLAELLGRLGQLNHYALLGIEPTASEAEVHAAYVKLARMVHPLHVERLALEGKEEVPRVLFERATEAYLTLSDAKRRSSYNLVAGIRVEIEVDEEKRNDEKRQLARQNYLLATHYMASTARDYAPAVDLLQEATRLDPKPEYFALLGQAQAKNPNWHLDAVESYRHAVRLSPKDAGIRVGFATLLEGVGDLEAARAEFQAALDAMPDHPAAREGLERLGAGQISEGLRGLFRK